MTKREKEVFAELVEFAESCIESPCYGCTSRGCRGIEKCSSTKWSYDLVQKAKALIKDKGVK